MPELPEVETVRRGLNDLVLNKKISSVDIYYDKMIVGDVQKFKDTLAGKIIETVDRRGKYLLIRFNGDVTVISHLRMEGKYYVKPKDEPLDKHTHVVFNFVDGTTLRYNDTRKFGRMELVKTGTEVNNSGIKKLGPEPTIETFKVDDFYRALQKKKKVIKTALLDQTIVTGLGNIYVDEVLWMTKIHPQTPAKNLSYDEAKKLHDNIIKELNLAIEAGGTTIRSYTDAFRNEGGFQFSLKVYQKTGEPCERCQTPIERIIVGQRGTHFCPKCQIIKA